MPPSTDGGIFLREGDITEWYDDGNNCNQMQITAILQEKKRSIYTKIRRNIVTFDKFIGFEGKKKKYPCNI